MTKNINSFAQARKTTYHVFSTSFSDEEKHVLDSGISNIGYGTPQKAFKATRQSASNARGLSSRGHGAKIVARDNGHDLVDANGYTIKSYFVVRVEPVMDCK